MYMYVYRKNKKNYRWILFVIYIIHGGAIIGKEDDLNL